jgi:hypothetical protein
MTVNAPDPFDDIVGRLNSTNTTPAPPAYTDPNPYGDPTAGGHPVKAGLTRRGKAALGIGAAVIAGGGLLGYQSYAADQAEADLHAQELALKADALELEKLKVLHDSATVDHQTATEQAAARQTLVDTCVDGLKNQVGKGYGAPTYGDVVEDCQAQYPESVSTTGMESVASQTAASDTSDSGGGGVSDGVLIGGLVLVGGVALAARKGQRPAQA